MSSSPIHAISSEGNRDARSIAIKDQDLQDIIEAAYGAPLSPYADYLSVVVIRDAAKRAQLANIVPNQTCIAKLPVLICVVADFDRASAILHSVDEAKYIFETPEGIATMSADAGMMLAAIKDACYEIGLGFALMDSFRFNSQAIADILSLPLMTFPVVGCGVGHFENKKTRRPRLKLSGFCQYDSWRKGPTLEDVAEYDLSLQLYWDRQQR